MAATSPYTPNDYTAVSNFRPYELPINDAFRAISAQNAFWDAGAAKVKAVYDNALNLKLSLEPNREIRKKYVEDSEKQLTKLSSMDVSDPSVQRQGFALFKPLFQDEGIIYDDLTTRHYEKVRNDALRYRTQDNGKQYSDINMQYAMQGYNEFLNSTNRMAGKEFYQNRKEYTPYYDYTEDFQKALKDCKPSSIETQSPNYGKDNSMTGYMIETYSKGLSAAQVQGCLGSGLSTNGQRQLQIEGAVGYKNNLPVLASDTASYLSGVSGNLSTQLQQLSGKKTALAANKTLTDAEKKSIAEQLDTEMTSVQQELDRTNNATKKITAGDFTDIQNNFDSYAGSVYSYKKLYKKALSSAFEERRMNYKADPVQLNAIRFSQEKYLRNLDFSFDVSIEQMKERYGQEMKLLDLMYGGSGSKGSTSGADVFRNPLTGEITLNPNLMRETANLTDKPEINEKIYGELTGEVQSLTEDDNKNNLTLYNSFKNRAERDKTFRTGLLKAFNYGNTDDEWARFKAEHNNNNFDGKGIQGTSWFKSYTAEKPDDEDVSNWSYQNTLVESGLAVLNRKLEIGEAQVAKEIGGDFRTQITKNIQSIKPLTVQFTNGSEVQITAQDIQNAIEGIPNSKGLQVVDDVSEFEKQGTKITSKRLLVNGKDNYQVNEMFKTVQGKNDTLNEKLDKKRVEVYNSLGFNREPWYLTPDKGKSKISEVIKAALPRDDKGKELDIRILSSDFSGGVKVNIPGVKKGEADGAVAALRSAGIGTSAEATSDGIVTIKGTTHNVIQQAIQNPVLAQAAFQMSTISGTQAFMQTQEGDRVPQGDIKVPVMIRGKQESLTIETYKMNDRPIYKVYVDGGTDSRPIMTASNAYELFEKIGRSNFDLNKPIK